MLPDELTSGLTLHTGTVREIRSVAGGSIHHSWHIRAGNGDWFLKTNSAGAREMFETEAKGLALLRSGGSGIRIPNAVATGVTAGTAWILMEFLEEERPHGDFYERFGRALAHLHRNTSATWGLDHDNYIGSLPQCNTPEKHAVTFMINHRLEPQVRLAMKKGFLTYADGEAFEELFTRLPGLIPDEPASLLHGDLWSGNHACTTGNEPAIFDPAVYYGHRESDLAFTRLFGGYAPEFYRAYHEAWPLQPGFETRVGLYNLYPLLVHVNLFGGSYVGQTRSVLRQYLGKW